MSVEDLTLVHPGGRLKQYGKKGMKWGSRSASRGADKIDRNGGTARSAAWRTAGKVVAVNVLTNVAAIGVRAIGGEAAGRGANVVAGLIQTGVLAKGVVDIIDINKAAHENEKASA